MPIIHQRLPIHQKLFHDQGMARFTDLCAILMKGNLEAWYYLLPFWASKSARTKKEDPYSKSQTPLPIVPGLISKASQPGTDQTKSFLDLDSFISSDQVTCWHGWMLIPLLPFNLTIQQRVSSCPTVLLDRFHKQGQTDALLKKGDVSPCSLELRDLDPPTFLLPIPRPHDWQGFVPANY